MSKKQIRVSVDIEVLKEARELGVNLSAAAEWGIKKRLEALKALNGINNGIGIEDLEAD